MSNMTVTNPIQNLPVTAAAKAQSQSAPSPKSEPAAQTQDFSYDQLRLQAKRNDTKNLIVGISTIGGLAGGCLTMLAAKTTTGRLIGMGIMGAGLMSGRIAEGKNIGEGAVAFVGAGASIGIGAAVGYATKQPLLGAAVTGVAILGTLALSRSLKED